MQTIYPDGSASTIGRMARWRAWDITRNNVGVTDTEREYRCDYENIQRLRGGLGGVAARRARRDAQRGAVNDDPHRQSHRSTLRPRSRCDEPLHLSHQRYVEPTNHPILPPAIDRSSRNARRALPLRLARKYISHDVNQTPTNYQAISAAQRQCPSFFWHGRQLGTAPSDAA